jgi:hypothetical protein
MYLARHLCHWTTRLWLLFSLLLLLLLLSLQSVRLQETAPPADLMSHPLPDMDVDGN